MRNKKNRTDLDNQLTVEMVCVDLDKSDHEISLLLREAFRGQTTSALIEGYTRAVMSAAQRRQNRDRVFKYLFLNPSTGGLA